MTEQWHTVRIKNKNSSVAGCWSAKCKTEKWQKDWYTFCICTGY
jgi:hypothetical protein